MNNISTSEFVLALSHLNKWGPTRIADFVIRHGYDFQECLNFLELELDQNELLFFKENVYTAREDLKCNYLKNIKSINLFDDAFPKKLCESHEPVIHLFYVGDISLLNSKCITIIGTRTPNEFFADKGEKVTKYFAEHGYTIVSGLAFGCDTIAHKETLKFNGKTIAILPSALDNVIPPKNRELAISIVKNGGLVISEYSINSTMNKFNYPQRDRIQSLLSNVSIVIQSEDDGGTMIAARKSLKDGKIVYALEGNNLTLIKNWLDADNIDQLREIEKLI